MNRVKTKNREQRMCLVSEKIREVHENKYTVSIQRLIIIMLLSS